MLKDVSVLHTNGQASPQGQLTLAVQDHAQVRAGQKWISKLSRKEITITRSDQSEVLAVSTSGDHRMSLASLRKRYDLVSQDEPIPADKNDHEMVTVTIRMTPEIAGIFFDNMAPNRGIGLRKLEALKHDMLSNRYELTHQSLGFNKAGQLIDGQHRSLACRDSGVTVLQRVTYYPGSKVAGLIEASLARDASDLRIGAPIDRGLIRGIAGQIEVANRGTDEEKGRATWLRIEAITKAINFLRENRESFGESKTIVPPVTEAIVESTYSMYKNEIDWVLTRTNCKFNSSVAAVVALAFGVFPTAMERLIAQLVTKENIPTGGPAGRLNNAMDSFKRSSGNQGRLRLMLMSAHGVRMFVGNKRFKGKGQLKPVSDAAAWLFDARSEAGKP